MKKYQGEDIFFSLTFNSDESGRMFNFDGLSNMIIYAYTSENNVSKFSLVEKDGYNKLSLSDNSLIISGVIKSAETKLMCGQLNLDILCNITTVNIGDEEETLIKKVKTDIFILDTIIKDEA